MLAEPHEYRAGRLEPPTGPGLGVTLDPERVGAYADAYRRDPDGYAFHDQERLAVSPSMPRL